MRLLTDIMDLILFLTTSGGTPQWLAASSMAILMRGCMRMCVYVCLRLWVVVCDVCDLVYVCVCMQYVCML